MTYIQLESNLSISTYFGLYVDRYLKVS